MVRDVKRKMVDLRLKTPFTMLIASPSKSGKTTLVGGLLSSADEYFDKPPKHIYYFYNTWSPTYNEIRTKNDKVKFIKGLCDKDWIETHCGEGEDVTIVLDDQALNLTKDIAEIFSVTSHQFNINCIMLAQNLFTKNKFFRDASLNATYIILGKNPRDQSSVRHPAQQMFPGRSSELVDAYKLATSEPYTHLLLDFNQSTPEHLRLRSNVLASGKPMSVYLKK